MECCIMGLADVQFVLRDAEHLLNMFDMLSSSDIEALELLIK